ncbi:MAG TPA: hypothetical protein VK968_01300 [Roseimicrobium sp.]|nr:hypothetical protein [Roseimicrobium sp.]
MREFLSGFFTHIGIVDQSLADAVPVAYEIGMSVPVDEQKCRFDQL